MYILTVSHIILHAKWDQPRIGGIGQVPIYKEPSGHPCLRQLIHGDPDEKRTLPSIPLSDFHLQF